MGYFKDDPGIGMEDLERQEVMKQSRPRVEA
jgi:hypothetical protein